MYAVLGYKNQVEPFLCPAGCICLQSQLPAKRTAALPGSSREPLWPWLRWMEPGHHTLAATSQPSLQTQQGAHAGPRTATDTAITTGK